MDPYTEIRKDLNDLAELLRGCIRRNELERKTPMFPPWPSVDTPKSVLDCVPKAIVEAAVEDDVKVIRTKSDVQGNPMNNSTLIPLVAEYEDMYMMPLVHGLKPLENYCMPTVCGNVTMKYQPYPVNFWHLMEHQSPLCKLCVQRMRVWVGKPPPLPPEVTLCVANMILGEPFSSKLAVRRLDCRYQQGKAIDMACILDKHFEDCYIIGMCSTVNSPFCFCLVNGEYGLMADTERIMKSQGLRNLGMVGYIPSKKTVEINFANHFMIELRMRADADKSEKPWKKLVMLQFETALLNTKSSFDKFNTYGDKVHAMLQLGLSLDSYAHAVWYTVRRLIHGVCGSCILVHGEGSDFGEVGNKTGVLSPSKLIMKLTGSTNQHRRKKDGSKSNTTSTRTSPSKLQGFDSDQLVKDSLLLSAPDEAEDFNKEVALRAQSWNHRLQARVVNEVSSQDSVCEDGCGKKKKQQLRKAESADRLTTPEDEQSSLDYDSNASSSNFEFPNGERARPRQLSRLFSRPPASSKWNDAEKWVMRRRVNEGSKKKSFGQSQMIARFPMISVSPGPESSGEDKVVRGGGLSRMLDMRTVDFCQPASQSGLDEFSFAPANVTTTATRSEDKAGIAVRPVAMRDTGTEMTPIESQDPSRTSTPAGATTPLCSPTISIPSTSGREPPPAPTSDRSLHMDHKRNVSEHEQKLKIRREIIALGKKNIAAWAGKEDETICNIFFSKTA